MRRASANFSMELVECTLMNSTRPAKNFPGVRLVIFDLDGTLIDSARDLINGVTDEQATEFRRDRHNRELFVMQSR